MLLPLWLLVLIRRVQYHIADVTNWVLEVLLSTFFSYNAPYDGMQLVLVFDTNNGSARAEVIIVVLVRLN